MIISAIASVDRNGAIGRAGALPWPRLPADMRWFASRTKGASLILGRRTWDSLPVKPLPYRHSVVLTHNAAIFQWPEFLSECTAAKNPEQVLDIALGTTKTNEVFVIGGQQIYSLFEPQIDRVYLTRLDFTAESPDTFFPIELPTTEWHSLFIKDEVDEKSGIQMSFWIYHRIDRKQESTP